jgi:hypothetical protein
MGGGGVDTARRPSSELSGSDCARCLQDDAAVFGSVPKPGHCLRGGLGLIRRTAGEISELADKNYLDR